MGVHTRERRHTRAAPLPYARRTFLGGLGSHSLISRSAPRRRSLSRNSPEKVQEQGRCRLPRPDTYYFLRHARVYFFRHARVYFLRHARVRGGANARQEADARRAIAIRLPTSLRTTSSQKCGAVSRRARISGSWTLCITKLQN